MTHPDAYHALAVHHFAAAYDLSRASHALRYEAVHGAPPNLSEDVRQQRDVVLTLAHKILLNAHEREMDLAFAHWQTYRRMTA